MQVCDTSLSETHTFWHVCQTCFHKFVRDTSLVHTRMKICMTAHGLLKQNLVKSQ
jgi:hypothetical protein